VSNRARFRAALESAGKVHLDASVLALHAVAHSRYLELTRVLFAGLSAGDFEASTSAISVYQLLVEPYRKGRTEAAEKADAYLSAIPGLRLVPLSPAIAGQAAQVRAQLGGSVERAVQIATALAGDAEVFLTQRSTLRRVAGMVIDPLDGYVVESSGVPVDA
jgi:hypothetical protein